MINPTVVEQPEREKMISSQVINELASAIQSSGFFDEKDASEYVSLQGLDLDIYKSQVRHLFLSGISETSYVAGDSPLRVSQNDCISGGTLRNSLYLEPLREITKIQDLSIRVHCKGKFVLRVFQVVFGEAPTVVLETEISGKDTEGTVVPLPPVEDYPRNCRLFWDITARENNCEIYEIDFQTPSPPISEGRLVVLLRTFGRSSDVCKLVDRMNEAARLSRYKDFFDRLYFVLLDTSNNVDDFYASRDCNWENLNYSIVRSSNLGGGGNASHLLYLIHQAFEKLGNEPDDLLILDDDLILSAESLKRYAAFCRYRSKEVVCSLPVLMKTRPNVVWEDGGYWGRFNHTGALSVKRKSLFPTLLKHGWVMEGFNHLDEFGSLNYCEYSTFIFFGLPYQTFKKMGYPTAFFLRGDDIEYSLRLNKAGIRLFTNPNLCAWHEPGHSYVQEYMAILHGLIINIAYGLEDPQYYLEFFEGRARDHDSVHDDAGIAVYAEILKTLATEPCILQHGFEDHYIDKFKYFKAFDKGYESLSPFVVQKIHEQQESVPVGSRNEVEPKGTSIVHFVHMGDHNDVQAQSFLLHNPNTHLYKHVDAQDLGQRKSVLNVKVQFYQYLEQFIANFDELLDRWKTRMYETQALHFWEEVHESEMSKTKVLSFGQRAGENIAHAEDNAWLKPNIPESKSESLENISETEIDESVIASSDDTETSLEITRRDKLELHLLPSSFNPSRYLELNPDVAASGIDAVEHYLKYGRHEVRAWN